MNSRNIVMVFAPNTTQTVDPLTALMYAVKVMNVMKMLITKTLEKEKQFHSLRNWKQKNTKIFLQLNTTLASGEKKGDEGRRNPQSFKIFKRTTFTRHFRDASIPRP
uniref:Rho GTPase-activating protein 4-like n=1 Tax=Tanacetum cinerariifolium TaxID=118510 RepID=A0A6L2P9F7_TANCI|nr:Rho GTPase-activating protein 4-like [Tanacetum cinerariifolium]